MKRKLDKAQVNNKTQKRVKPTLFRFDTQDTYDFLSKAANNSKIRKYFKGNNRIDPSVFSAINNLPMSTIRLFKDQASEVADMLAQANQIATKKQEEIEKLSAISYVAAPLSNESFGIMFMNIGSGDCIFIKTPKGKTIVVDCGNRARPQSRANYLTEIQQMLESPTFLSGKNKELYALILTHPDLDHYQEVPKIVKPSVSSIRHVFYTMKVGKYSENKTYVVIKQASFYNQVKINNTSKSMVSNLPKWENYYLTDDSKGIQILGNAQNKDQWNEENCSIYLLAAEVPATYITGGGEESNAASMVTLIEVYGRKILLCGDATLATEKFLLEKYPEILKDIDLLHLEHHGSGTSHAGIEFVYMVNPRLAVVSSGSHDGDKNPRWPTIEKYVNQSKLNKSNPKPHRLTQIMDIHRIVYSNNEQWNDLNSINDNWNPKYQKYGLYTTPLSNNGLFFKVTKTGEIIREFCDVNNRYIYTVKNDGTVTNTQEKISS